VSNKSRGISARTALAAEAGGCGIVMTWTVQRASEITADAPRQRWLAEHSHQHDQVASALKLAGGTQGATDRYIMQHNEASQAHAGAAASAEHTSYGGGGGSAHPAVAGSGGGARSPSASSTGSRGGAIGIATASEHSSPDPTAHTSADVLSEPKLLPSGRRPVSSLRLPSADLDMTSDEALLAAFNDLHGTKRMLNWLVAGIDPATTGQRSDRLALRDSGADPLMALVPSAGKRRHSSVFRYTTVDTTSPVYIYLRFNRHVATSSSAGSVGTTSPQAESRVAQSKAGSAAGSQSSALGAQPSDSSHSRHKRGQSVSSRSLQAEQQKTPPSTTRRGHRHSVSMGLAAAEASARQDTGQQDIPWSQYATKGSATATFVLITWNPPASSNTMMLQHRRAVSKRFPHHVHLTLTSLSDLNARSILSRIRNVLNMSSVTLTLEIIPAAALLNPQAIHTKQNPSRVESSNAGAGSAMQQVHVKRVQLEIPEGYTLGALRQDISTQLGINVEHQRVFQLRKFTGSSRVEELAESVAHLRAASSSLVGGVPGLAATEPSPSELHSAAIHSVLGRDPQPPTTAASLVVELMDSTSSIQNTVSGGDTLFIQIVDDTVAHLLPSTVDSFSLRQSSNVSEPPADSQGGGEWASPPRNRTDSEVSLHVDVPLQLANIKNLHMPASPMAGRVPRVGTVASSLVLSPVPSERSDSSGQASFNESAVANGPAGASPTFRPSKTSLEVMSAVISRVHAARVAEVREVEEERRSTMLRRHGNLMNTIKKLKGMKLGKVTVSGEKGAQAAAPLAIPSAPPAPGVGGVQGGAAREAGALAGGGSALASQLRLQRASLRKITPRNLSDALADAAGNDDALSHALSSLGDGSSLSQGEADEVASTLSAHVEQLREEVSYLELQMNELKITEPAVGEGATASVYRALWVSPGAIEEVDESAEGGANGNITESGARFITDPGVEVALKKFNYVAAQPPPKALKEFKTEVAALRKLPPHPNVVRLIGACTNPGMAIIYEYMPQGTLFHALRSKLPLNLSDRLNLALDCAKGLSHLHVNSILHRDIKSHNILLDLHQGRLRAKLGDLGCSRVLAETGDEAMAKTELGTAGYVAPEVLYGVPYAFPADVFSLGVLLYEIFAPTGPDGRVNLPTKDIPIGRYCMEFEKGYRMQWPDIPAEAPEWVLPLVHACMQSDPTARLQSSEIVQKLLGYQQEQDETAAAGAAE